MDTSYAAQFANIWNAWEQLAYALEQPAWASICGRPFGDLTEDEFYAGLADMPDNAWVLLDAHGRIERASLADGLSRNSDPLDGTVIVYSDDGDVGWCEWDEFSGGCPCCAMSRDDAEAWYGSEDDD